MKKISLIIILTLLCSAVSIFGQNKNISTIKSKKISTKQLDSFVAGQMDSLKIPGLSLAIINNGSIVYVKNYGVKNSETKEKVDENTIFEACSLSKPVFAYFVLKQVEKGVLDLDKPLYSYYSDPKIDTANDYYKLVTARMVLSHSTGFPNWRKDENFSNPLFFINQPGTKFGYSGEGFQYLARVLGKILNLTDQELNALFQKEVVKPLKIKSMNFTWNDSLKALKAYSHRNGKPTDNSSQGPKDWFGSAGSLHTNARDYAMFLVYLMKNDNSINRQFLTLQTDLPAQPDGLFRSFGFPYKMSDEKIKFYHTGNNSDTRAYCHFYPKQKLGVVMFSNCDNFFESGFATKVQNYLDEEALD
jgi:CubicO group peptidase (beta-lactamase class C family)